MNTGDLKKQILLFVSLPVTDSCNINNSEKTKPGRGQMKDELNTQGECDKT